MIAVRSASERCARVATRARTWPTRRCSTSSGGRNTIERIASRQSSTNIAAIEAPAVTMLPTIAVNVERSVVAMPPTSFCSRDCSSPVFVAVKNASSIDISRSNIRTRRSVDTELPMREVMYV